MWKWFQTSYVDVIKQGPVIPIMYHAGEPRSWFLMNQCYQRQMTCSGSPASLLTLHGAHTQGGWFFLSVVAQPRQMDSHNLPLVENVVYQKMIQTMWSFSLALQFSFRLVPHHTQLMLDSLHFLEWLSSFGATPLSCLSRRSASIYQSCLFPTLQNRDNLDKMLSRFA